MDGKSLEEENLGEIIGKLINLDIAEVKLDERGKVWDFQRFKEVENVEGDTIGAQFVAKGLLRT